MESSHKVSVAVLGGTGYTARELVRLLLAHPHADVRLVTSRQESGQALGDVHPVLRGRTRLRIEPYDPAAVAEVDCVFSCLPHGAAAELVAPLVDRGARIIDLSADYRLSSAELYHAAYGYSHPDPARLSSAVYGLAELFASSIQRAQLVANPGCFPTATILALAPLLIGELIDDGDIIVDAKTGISGAGRSPKLASHFPECNESVAAYGVGTHRHGPEIDDILRRVVGRRIDTIFTPHLVSMDRGILATIYVRPAKGTSADSARDALARYYADQPFVRVVEGLPATKDVFGTNYCDLAVHAAGERLVVLSVIDNLIKGASGAAVQNFNLMWGFDQACGLV